MYSLAKENHDCGDEPLRRKIVHSHISSRVEELTAIHVRLF